MNGSYVSKVIFSEISCVFTKKIKEKNNENQMGALMKSICHLKKPEDVENENGNEIFKSINNYAYRKKNYKLF